MDYGGGSFSTWPRNLRQVGDGMSPYQNIPLTRNISEVLH